MGNTRLYNLEGIRNALFAQMDWAPSQADIARERLDEFIERAYFRLAQDAPYLFFEEEILWAVHPDSEPTLATDLLEVDSSDPWVLVTELTVASDIVNPLEYKDAGGRMLLLKVPDSNPAEWHAIRIREAWLSLSDSKYRYSLETPWRNGTDTGIEYRIIANEFTLPDDLIELRNVSLHTDSTGYHYPLQFVGQTRAEFSTLPSNHLQQSTGSPRSLFRREHQSLQAPTLKPEVAEQTQGGQTWSGDEPTGSFQYLYTYVWGKQEIWAHGPGPESQSTTSLATERYEPYWESPPSPVSDTVTHALSLAIDVSLPNIDFMLGFDDAGTARYHRAGIKKRIYRRRISSDGTIESPNTFFLLDEVDGHETTYTDNGTITPDYKRPFRAVHGYQTFRLHPKPDKRYTLVLRAIMRPRTLVDDADTPKIHKDGVEALIQRASMYLYESAGNAAMARYSQQEYDKTLFQLAKRYGDIRPANRLRHKAVARTRRRGGWRRELDGIVDTA